MASKMKADGMKPDLIAKYTGLTLDDIAKIQGILGAHRYLEPVDRIDTLIVVKSIISGSCVVKTNLMDMLDKYTPEQIFILAPVMHKDAERKLKAEFNSDVTDRFTFYSFAIDNTREQDGTVIPGIGGDVYQRLGFKDQNDKNRYTPALIKSRRELLPA